MVISQELSGRAQWLIWRFETNPKNKEGKKLKVPYYASGKRRVGTQGSPEDRRKLVTFDVACAAADLQKFDGIGFAFLPDDGLIGVDLDNVIDPETGEVAERARNIIQACDSYTEYSPSGKGVHIFVLGKTETFKSNDIGVEVFCNAQYFTYTGRHYSGTPDTVNPIDDGVLRRLKATIDEAKAARKRPAGAPAQAALPAPEKAKRRVSPDGISDFKMVNEAALQNLDAWVPVLLPAAKRTALGYRVASADLGRDLQEDLSITSMGIRDWGVDDLSAGGGGRSPIDLVIEWGKVGEPKDALHWLAGHLGITLEKPQRRARPASEGDVGGPPEPPPEGEARPETDDDGGYGLPVIRWTQGMLPYAVNDAEKALIASDEQIYQRAGFLVRVVRRDTPSVRNYNRQPGSLGVHLVDTPYLVEAFTRCARWEKWDGKAKDWRRINAPEQAAATYMARVGQWKVPRLWSVISAPTLRPDGTVLQTPGYDAATQTWYDPGEAVFPTIPENPSAEDAKYAMEQLQEAFGSFPFDASVDRSVYLALALTALVRRSLPSSPLGAISAPVMASGKTLLADCIAILATGSVAPAMKFADSDEEAAKTALAVLAEGDQVVLIDNVERPLQGDWLCSILTSESYRQRVLGVSKMMTVPTTTLFLATGNHLVIAGDLRTRALLCLLDPKCEHPELRQFAYDMREKTTADRARLVVAGLTVMRAFICARAKNPKLAAFIKPYGRFEHWSEMVRAPMLWLSMTDPCESIKAIEADDPHRGEHIQMLHAWKALFGQEPQPTADVIAEIDKPPHELGAHAKQFSEIARPLSLDRQKNLSAKRLGHWLRQHANRRVQVGDELMQFVKVGEKNHAAVWKLEVVAQTGMSGD